MKRIVVLVLLLLLSLNFASCGEVKDDTFSIVCTNFPLYDWARELTKGADGVEVVLLADGGRDLHSYEPSAKDMMTISDCELFLGGGGVSEAWLTKTLQKKPLLLAEYLKDELLEDDEHLWLSPRLAKKACEGIFALLIELDEKNGAIYHANFKRYVSALDDLAAMFEDAVKDAHVLVFADRYPFRYLFHDLGISVYAAFPGCSSESEASFETVAFLAQKVEECDLSSVLAVKGSDLAVAKTVASSVKGSAPEILTLDSLETVKNKETESYIERMSVNARILKKAFD